MLNNKTIGGVSKLLTYFIQAHNPSTLLSYCDRALFNGKGYISSGFTSKGSTPPSYVYTKNYKTIESRFMFQKHMLKDKLREFDETRTEWENMQANGYDRIWDCGTLVFELVKESI